MKFTASRRRLLAEATLPIAATTALLHGTAAPAGATTNCRFAGQIFAAEISVYGTRILRNGTSNDFYVYNHTYPTSGAGHCDYAKWVDSAHVRLNGSALAQVEVGQQEYLLNGVKYHRIFTEWQEVNGTVHGPSYFTACTVPVNGYSTWKVYLSSPANWSLNVDCHDGGGVRHLTDYYTGFTSGYSMGEMERYGDDTSGYGSFQSNLAYYDINLSGWRSWYNNSCYSDNDPTYRYTYQTSTAFSIINSAGGC